MWEKKIYPLDKSKKKSKGIRKQRHHAVSSNQLLVPDRCGTSSHKSKKKSKGIRKQHHHAVSSNQLLVPDRCGTSSHKSKKKSKGIRKQCHHAVSSNQLLVLDRCGTSSHKAHWSRLYYGSASCMLSQLMNEFDDGFDDYDNDHNMDYADGDATDMGYVEHEVGQVETDRVEEQVYGLYFADHGGHSHDMGNADYEVGENETDDLTGGGVEREEQEEAEMMGYVYVEFERDVESEDEWLLIGDM